jgi:polyisoprenyl-phosphate glycosyltransferase
MSKPHQHTKRHTMKNKLLNFISVVIPIYNEEENLHELNDRIVKVMKQYKSYEILYVNDGSSDYSKDIITAFCVSNPSIKLLSLSRNFGHQIAITAGLEYSSGNVVVVMDGDLQDPPEVLPTFFSKILEGYDVVYAIRKSRKEGLFKKMCYFIFYRILKIISETKIPLDSGDFSVMSRTVVNELKLMPERNRFIRGMRAWLGYKQIGVEYERDSRFSGNSKYTFKMLNKLAYDGIISSSRKPLSLILTFGMIITVTSFFAIVAIIYMKLFGGIMLEGWTSLIIVVLLMGGVQLTVLGIIGEYIGRIFDESKGRPNFLIEDTININSKL